MGGRLLDFLGQGLAAARPAAAGVPALIPAGSAAVYYAYDTGIFSFFDEDAVDWVELDLGALSAMGFQNLSDVDWTTPPTDGQIMVWDNTAGKWIPGGQTVIDLGSGAVPGSLPTNGVPHLWIRADDGAHPGRALLDAWGGHLGFSGRRANGTRAAPTALQAGDSITFINGFGYGATDYSLTGRISFDMQASENWTDAAQGTKAIIQTTPNGSTTPADALEIGQDKSLKSYGPISTNYLADVNFVLGNLVTNAEPVSSVTASAQIHGTNANPPGFAQIRWDNVSAGGAPTSFFARSRGITLNSRGVVASGDRLGQILASGDDGTNFVSAAAIRFEVDGTPGTNDMPGRIVFLVSPDGSATLAQAFRVNQDKTVTFAGDITIPDEAYDATNWNGNLEAPTKNAVRDKIESVIATIPAAYTDGDADARIAAASIGDLSDVDHSTPPTDGQILVWDDGAGNYVPDDPGGGGGSLAVDDDSVEIVAAASRLNFTGAGVTVTDLGSGEVEINIPGAGGIAVPAIVQSKIVALADISAGVTLDSAPTEGNILVAIIFNSVSANPPANTSGWTSLHSNTTVPDHLVNWRTVGAGESALQNPTTTVEGGIIAIYELEGTVAVSQPLSLATVTVLSVSFSTNNEYLPTSSGIGIVYGGRRTGESGSWSGSFADDLTLTDGGGVVGGSGVSVATGIATVPLNSSLTASCTWATAVASKAGFILIA